MIIGYYDAHLPGDRIEIGMRGSRSGRFTDDAQPAIVLREVTLQDFLAHEEQRGLPTGGYNPQLLKGARFYEVSTD